MLMAVVAVPRPMMFVAVVMVVSRMIMLVMRMIFGVDERFAGRASQIVARGIAVVGMFVHLLYATHHKGVAPL
jgi:hypothetical protein